MQPTKIDGKVRGYERQNALTWGFHTDAQLLRAGRDGEDPYPLGELMERHRRRLITYLYRLTKDRDLAADLFQHTWLKLLESLRSGSCGCLVDADCRGYLLRIARNLYIDRCVRRHDVNDIGAIDRHCLDLPISYEDEEAVEQAIHWEQVRRHLSAALDMLPELQRDAVDLWMRGETAESAARALSVPRDTFLSRKKYALEKLKRILAARGIGTFEVVFAA